MMYALPSPSKTVSNKLFDMTGDVGTLRYMAPEVFLNKKYGLECDIFSWSIVSYEVLSQAKPYEDLTPDAYRVMVCQQGLRPGHMASHENQDSDLSKECKVLLSQAWRTDPNKRPTLSCIKSELDIFLQNEKMILDAYSLARCCLVFV